MFRFMVLTLVLAAAAVLPAAAGDSPPPDRLKEPAVELAQSASKRVEGDEAEWERLTSDLAKALDGYAPGPLSLGQEEKVLGAFREYVKKQLDDGRSIVTLYEKWTKASAALADSTKKAPGYYREAAKLYRGYAAEARFADNKERYTLVGDTWDALARQAEKRVKDLDLEANPGGLIDFLKESNLFLERFVDTLDALPRSSGATSAEYKQLVEKLRKHAEKFDGLKKNLKQFREKVGSTAFNPQVRDAVAVAARREKILERLAANPLSAVPTHTEVAVGRPRLVVTERSGNLAQMVPVGDLWVWVGKVYPTYEYQGAETVATGKVQVVRIQGRSAIVKRVSGRLTDDSVAFVN